MKRPLVLLLVSGLALPALAQDAARDWDMLRDPGKKLTMAYTQFNTGLGIAARCVDESYEAIITGLPSAGEGETRVLQVAFGDGDLHPQRWNVAVDDTIAVSELPAPFARKLREGGRLRVMIPGGAEGGRNLTHDLTLPASSSSIDETLTVCERPLIDPRDAELADLPEGGLPANLTWARPPRPSFPSRIRYARGFATVLCLTSPDGSLRDCSVEAEHPQDGGFGDAALRATRRARVVNIDAPATAVPPGRILYRTNFIVAGHQTREDERLRREQRERERENRERMRAAGG
ncbi:MAG: hypothetical protein U1E18_08185 [Brevundimonas sp.]|uniref:hypothetical protein n=1 Tax=Brevundimonas sp. TaxID=1871086 RepID=UPI002AB96C4D|nr:hypothetical protein [Brevundimonas sp.]MDZ4109561.1 hypothetical protein [Brevundimonas sp.]